MRISLFSSVLFLIVGCADGTVPPPNNAHPASANAAEGTAYVPPPATSSAPAEEHKDHEHGAASEKVTYTCPMHPEVVSDKPGQCPKCGMTLVPKKKDAP